MSRTLCVSQPALVKPAWNRSDVREILDMVDPPVGIIGQFLLLLYSAQTEDEQKDFATVAKNGAGFNSYDAEFLSTLARRARWRLLSPRECECAARQMRKYSRQIADLLNGEMGEMDL